MIESKIDEAHFTHIRLLEALLFASAQPLDIATLQTHLGQDVDIDNLLQELSQHYAHRGVRLVQTGGRWAFRTAPDIAPHLQKAIDQPRKLPRVAVETLAIIAYHQPVTRAEIESIRGVTTSKETLDLLMSSGWIKPGRRLETPGRPLTWMTTDTFLDHFDLPSLKDLPGIDDLRAAGLLDARPAIVNLSDSEEDLFKNPEDPDIEEVG